MGLFSKKIDEIDYFPSIKGGSNGTHSFKRGEDTAIFQVKNDKHLKSFQVMLWQRKRHAFINIIYDKKTDKFICYGDDGNLDTGTKGIKIKEDDDHLQFHWEIPNTFALEVFHVLMRVIVQDTILNHEDEITIHQSSGVLNDEKKEKIEKFVKYAMAKEKEAIIGEDRKTRIN